jgi:uncharacterized phiE125 gp8 family phage protein
MLSLVTPPSVEPITLAVAKSHLRVEIGDDDSYIGLLLSSARDAVEQYIRRALYAQTWRLTLAAFPSRIELPVPPAVSITEIAYVDENEVSQVLASSGYRLTVGDYGILTPAYGESWPNTLAVSGAVTVTFVAGYTSNANPGDPDSAVPPSIKHAILLKLGHMYENREEVVTGTIAAELPQTSRDLLGPYRSVNFNVY